MKSLFLHKGLTLSEAMELVAMYKARNKVANRELESNGQTWTVSVMLPESHHLPRSKMSAHWMWN